MRVTTVERAQSNQIDFGFGALPTLCQEDLIIAKAFAQKISPDRFQDLDDIRSIFAAKHVLQLEYLQQLAKHGLPSLEKLVK